MPPCSSTEPIQSQSTDNKPNRADQHREERLASPTHRAASVDTKLDAVHLEPSSEASEASEAAEASSSSKTDDKCLTVTEREYLARRDERLKRLETEAQAYMNLVKSTNRRAVDVDTKLEFLHGLYGDESDVAGTAIQTQTTISEQQQPSSTNDSQTSSDIPMNDEPPNQQDQSETDHSSIETMPNTNENDECNENPSD